MHFKTCNIVKFASITLGFLIVGTYALPHPASAESEENNSTVSQSNLKYTFGSDEEIPAGFFDTPDSPVSKVQARQADDTPQFAACKDGSGGFCIPLGQCEADKKPEVVNAGACEAGEECCFGLPPSNTPCRNRGGECTKPPRSCGKGPQLRTGTECDHENGEICCIWTF